MIGEKRDAQTAIVHSFVSFPLFKGRAELGNHVYCRQLVVLRGPSFAAYGHTDNSMGRFCYHGYLLIFIIALTGVLGNKDFRNG